MDYINQALPAVAILAMAFVSCACYHAATYLQERTHNVRLARVVNAMGRIAGDIVTQLNGLPPGANLADYKGKAILTGVRDIQTEFTETLIALGAPPVPQLAKMLSGEVGILQSVTTKNIGVHAP